MITGEPPDSIDEREKIKNVFGAEIASHTTLETTME